MSQISIIDRSVRTLVAVVFFPFTIWQNLLSKYELRKYRPTGKLTQIQQRYIHSVVTGDNKHPTIILESGMGGCSLDWSLVQPELSKHASVLSYDRSGFGWSMKTMDQPTIQNYVNDLRLLLNELYIKPPYILVGHSYGGMIMRLFASEYADEVQGLVLVDSTHENRFLYDNLIGTRVKERKNHMNMVRLGYLLSPVGIPRLLKRHIGVKRLPTEFQKKVTSLGCRNNAFKAAYLESLYTEESALQLKHASPLKDDLPIVVLSARKQTEEWKKGQSDLLNLSQQTTQIWVEDSWHAIQVYRPDAVIKAVKSLLRS